MGSSLAISSELETEKNLKYSNNCCLTAMCSHIHRPKGSQTTEVRLRVSLQILGRKAEQEPKLLGPSWWPRCVMKQMQPPRGLQDAATICTLSATLQAPSKPQLLELFNTLIR